MRITDTIQAPCLGCATPLTYEIDHDGSAPVILPAGVAYRDGHLCPACHNAVEALLRTRRAPFVTLPATSTPASGLDCATVPYADRSEVA